MRKARLTLTALESREVPSGTGYGDPDYGSSGSGEGYGYGDSSGSGSDSGGDWGDGVGDGSGISSDSGSGSQSGSGEGTGQGSGSESGSSNQTYNYSGSVQFHIVTNDGVHNIGHGFGCVSLYLVDQSGYQVPATLTTTPDGEFTFSDLSAGNYTLYFGLEINQLVADLDLWEYDPLASVGGVYGSGSGSGEYGGYSPSGTWSQVRKSIICPITLEGGPSVSFSVGTQDSGGAAQIMQAPGGQPPQAANVVAKLDLKKLYDELDKAIAKIEPARKKASDAVTSYGDHKIATNNIRTQLAAEEAKPPAQQLAGRIGQLRELLDIATAAEPDIRKTAVDELDAYNKTYDNAVAARKALKDVLAAINAPKKFSDDVKALPERYSPPAGVL